MIQWNMEHCKSMDKINFAKHYDKAENQNLEAS